MDASIVVVTCLNYPLKEHIARFLGEVPALRRRAAIPISIVLSVYHVATRY